MKFDRIRLRNFKPYADADLELGDGVTVIHGLNGSGKSSLLEACFFALYGARALDGTLEEVVTNGAEESEIDLWFTHDGGEYHVRRRLRATGDRTTTAECVLESPGGTVEGARDVRGHVTDLLRMDAEAFLNCAYVRQGEVNKLINATPGERQDMIDDLLQLGRLEEYRERAAEARLGVNDVLSDERGRLSQIDEQIEAKESTDPHERLNALESELNEVVEGDRGIEHFEAQKRTAERTRDDARRVLDEYEQKRAELGELSEEIEGIEETVRETERERERLRERIGEARDRIDSAEEELSDLAAEAELDAAERGALADRRAELDGREAELDEAREDARDRVRMYANQSERLRERADDDAEAAAERRERADRLDAEADDAEADLDSRRERLGEIESELDAVQERFADAPADLGGATDLRESVRDELADVREERSEVAGELTSARDRVEGAERLLAEGKCPECGQDVAGSPHVEGVDEDRERVDRLASRLEELTERRDALEADLDDAESLVEAEGRAERLRDTRRMLEERVDEVGDEIERKREQAGRLREEAADLDSEAEQKRSVAGEKADEAEAAREAVADVDAELDAVARARDRLDAVESKLDAVEDAEAEIERLRERRENRGELKAERQNRLADLRERRDDLRESFDEERVERARESRESAEEYLERVEDELASLRERRDDLQSRIGGAKQDISQLEELRERRETLAERVASLESLHEETEELERAYGNLRAELRRRNVESLERMLNETFDLVYANDAYSHIELDGEYELTVYQKDGAALDPEQLSGGERALFNLSLRCAIYRLLSEGIEGAAPTPPLILDEPTVFLDSGHVSRLVDLVEEMRGFGVRQIVIVSHDEELVDAADDLVTVEKDPTTNRSSVGHEDPVASAALELSADD